MLYKLAFFELPFDEDSSLGILNGRCNIPEESPYSDNLHKLISTLPIIIVTFN